MAMVTSWDIFYIDMPHYNDFRASDIKHSLADILKAKNNLGYNPFHKKYEVIKKILEGYVEN